jgi:hypothetical protein
MKDNNFDALLKGTDKAAWEDSKVVVNNFLGIYKALVANTLRTSRIWKLHYLHSRLNFCQASLWTSVASEVTDSTEIPQPWKNTSKGNAAQQCLLSTTGNLKEKFQLQTRENQV